MSTEIYDNIQVNKPAPLDAKSVPVAAVGNLPNPNTATNFLYLGAEIFVTGENAKYRVEVDPTNSANRIWVKQAVVTLVAGVINIVGSTTALDFSLVTPAIALCDTVTVNVTGVSTTASISVFLNFPAGFKKTIYVQNGKTLTLKHTDYASANAGQIVLEDGFDMTLTGRAVGNESIIVERNVTAIVQVGATQFIKQSEWAKNLLSIAIADNLTSSSAVIALSANQGKVLDTKKQDKLTAGGGITIANNIITTNSSSWVKIDYTFAQAPSRAAEATYDPIIFLTTSIRTDGAVSFSGPPVSNIPEISPSNRYVDLRPSAAYSYFIDGGLWLLPAGLPRSVANNWVCIEKPAAGQPSVSYKFPAVTIGTSSTGICPIPVIKTIGTGVGGLLERGVTWGSFNAGTAGRGYSFSLPGTVIPSLYEIEFRVNSNTVTSAILQLKLYLNYNNYVTHVNLNPTTSNTALDIIDVTSNSVGTSVSLKTRLYVSAGDLKIFWCSIETAVLNLNIFIYGGELTITKLT